MGVALRYNAEGCRCSLRPGVGCGLRPHRNRPAHPACWPLHAAVQGRQASGPGRQLHPIFPRPAYLDGTIPGDMGFDPMGIGSWDVLNMNFLREAEIKHGRLAMLAFVGIMVEGAGIKFPGVAATLGNSNDIFEIHNAAVAKGSMGQILLGQAFSRPCVGCLPCGSAWMALALPAISVSTPLAWARRTWPASSSWRSRTAASPCSPCRAPSTTSSLALP